MDASYFAWCVTPQMTFAWPPYVIATASIETIGNKEQTGEIHIISLRVFCLWLTTCLLYVCPFIGKSISNKLVYKYRRIVFFIYHVKSTMIVPVHGFWHYVFQSALFYFYFHLSNTFLIALGTLYHHFPNTLSLLLLIGVDMRKTRLSWRQITFVSMQ